MRLWRAIVERSGLDDKVIAADADMTPQYYSKVASGSQGDLLGLAFRVGKTHPELHRQFIDGLAALESVDPYADAVEQLHGAALRVLRMQVPMRASRFAKADLPLQSRKVGTR